MNKNTLAALIALAILSVNAWGAEMILNEYNAVDDGAFLGGGTAAADVSGGHASDTHFGRVPGNGGDWFEMVVVKDHLDVRGWQLDLYENGTRTKTLTLTAHAVWKDLRAGTIVTVSAKLPSDISYNPAAGDWWINVQAHEDADGLFIGKTAFTVSANNWQLRIRNKAGDVVFGPAGEGISPSTGIGRDEVFRLEDDPSEAVTANSPEYDDGDDISTFGEPNRWGVQKFGKLRPVIKPTTAP